MMYTCIRRMSFCVHLSFNKRIEIIIKYIFYAKVNVIFHYLLLAADKDQFFSIRHLFFAFIAIIGILFNLEFFYRGYSVIHRLSIYNIFDIKIKELEYSYLWINQFSTVNKYDFFVISIKMLKQKLTENQLILMKIDLYHDWMIFCW